jgi:hypothetical protein
MLPPFENRGVAHPLVFSIVQQEIGCPAFRGFRKVGTTELKGEPGRRTWEKNLGGRTWGEEPGDRRNVP